MVWMFMRNLHFVPKTFLKITSSISRKRNITSYEAVVSSLTKHSPERYNFYLTSREENPQKCFLSNDIIDTFLQEKRRKIDVENRLVCQIRQTSNSQFTRFLRSILERNEPISLLKESQLKILIKVLDFECIRRLNSWNSDDKLFIIDIWHLLTRSKFQNSRFYKKIFKNFNLNSLNAHNLVQLIYYVGLTKNVQMKWLAEYERRLDRCYESLNVFELDVVFHAFFKCKAKISSESLLDYTANLLTKNIREHGADSNHFLGIIKQLRLCNFYDPSLLDAIEHRLAEPDSTTNIALIVHYLACFSNVNVYPKELFERMQRLVSHLLFTESRTLATHFPRLKAENVHKMHPSVRARTKDIARFLWIVSVPLHQISQHDLEFLTEIISERFQRGEFEPEPQLLVDCVASLALYGCYPLHLIRHIFSPNFVKSIMSSKQTKSVNKLYQIQGSLDIEGPSYDGNRLSDDDVKKFNQLALGRANSSIRYVVSLLDKFDEQTLSYSCCFNLPHFRIPGIEVTFEQENGKKCAIEVMDSSFTIRNTNMPTGVFAAKIRQLKKLGVMVVVISLVDIEQLKLLPKAEKLQALWQIINFSN